MYNIKVLIFLLISIIIIYSIYKKLVGNNALGSDIEDFTVQGDRPFSKCYVINLTETNEGRRRWKLLNRHPIISPYINHFKGIYGKKYDYSQEVSNKIVSLDWDIGKWQGKSSKIIQMDSGEIGCILSHRLLWEKIYNEGLESTLILEDDAIEMPINFIKLVNRLNIYLPQDWDIFLLGFWLHRGNDSIKVNKYIYKVKNFCLLHSYIVSKQGVKKLLNLGIIDKPLDTWISLHSNTLNIYRHNIVGGNRNKPSSRLILQRRQDKQIINTNNW